MTRTCLPHLMTSSLVHLGPCTTLYSTPIGHNILLLSVFLTEQLSYWLSLHQCIKYLVETAGLEVLKPDNSNATPIDLADRHSRRRCRDFLKIAASKVRKFASCQTLGVLFKVNLSWSAVRWCSAHLVVISMLPLSRL